MKKLDARHKEAVRLYLREFFELFFPKLAPLLSFEGARFLDRETIALKDDPDQKDIRTRTDALILIEMKLNNRPEWILIHWEQQGGKESNFEQRMFHYFCGAYYKFKRPVFPIAFFTDRAKWRVHLVHSYQIVIGDYPIVNYSFELIRMRKYSWQDFLERAKTNPLAAAYLPLTDYPKEKRPWILAHSLRLIAAKVKSGLKRATLLSLAERSVRLNDNEKKEFKEIISSDPQFQEVGMLQSVEEMYQEKWEEIGFEKGIEQGILNTIPSLLESGVSWDIITKATGITQEEFENMQARNSTE